MCPKPHGPVLHNPSLRLPPKSRSPPSCSERLLPGHNQFQKTFSPRHSKTAGCCNARVPCTVSAIEIQKNLCDLIQENAALNKQKTDVFLCDILGKKDPLKGKLFHHVVTNPPFYEKTTNIRKNTEQQKAYVQDFDLKKWLSYCLRHLRSNGSFNLIHRPEALAEILAVLGPKLGNVEIFPVVSKEGEKAKRILIRGYLNKKGPLTLHSPIIMHTKDNQRTDKAEEILRFGKAI